MKNTFLFHGYNGKNLSHWMLWLEKELIKKDIPVNFPSYKNSKRPNMQDWLHMMQPILSTISSDTTFVGHSFGCLVAFKILEALDYSIDRAILVACPKNKIEGKNLKSLLAKISEKDKKILHEFVEQEYDWEKIHKNVKKIIFCYSDNDYAVPYDESISYYKEIFPDAEYRTYKGYGHFNYKTDINTMPDIFEIILNDRP